MVWNVVAKTVQENTRNVFTFAIENLTLWEVLLCKQHYAETICYSLWIVKMWTDLLDNSYAVWDVVSCMR